MLATERSPLRTVALPSEHGGWGLTLEPVLLGLLLAPSWPGAAIGAAAFSTFLARTPLKLVLVDRRRGRWLPRSQLASRVAAVELAVVTLLVGAATVGAGADWWLVVAAAAPLVVVELWFDVRSRGRRLVPELAGAVGVAAATPAIVVAGGGGWTLAVAAWGVLAARAVGSIPCVRAQILRARHGGTSTLENDVAQLASLVLGAAVLLVDRAVAGGTVALVAAAAAQYRWARRTPSSIKRVGFTQMAVGLAIVVATAGGAALT